MTENRTFIEVISPTVDQAIARGLSDLGLDDDAVVIEVLDEGDPTAGREARVRLTVLAADAGPQDSTAVAARQVLQDLLGKMRPRGNISARWVENADDPTEPPQLYMDILGDDLAMLIGRKGETLAALQYIVRLIVGKQLGGMVDLVVDVEGYKLRHEQQLRRLAERMAEQAVQRGRTLALEPMSAGERRIIHLALRNHPGVTTESVGEGTARKVTIIPKTVK